MNNKMASFSTKLDFIKNIVWSLSLNLNLYSNPLFYNFIDIINDLPDSNLWKYDRKIRSSKRDPSLKKGEIACIMCTWMEEQMVPFAIESTKDFVDKYYIVDKDGSTASILKHIKYKWNIDMDIYIKPNLNLVESRLYALRKIHEPWILIQDGDMVFHTDGLQSISNLRKFMEFPDVVICSQFIVLCMDFNHTYSLSQNIRDFVYTDIKFPIMKHHKILYHNNGTIRAPGKRRDFLISDGWKIFTKRPFIFNCLIKSPKRMYIRKYWKEYNKINNNRQNNTNIENYITNRYNIDLNLEIIKENHKLKLKLIKYQDKKWGHFPKIIRKYLNV